MGFQRRGLDGQVQGEARTRAVFTVQLNAAALSSFESVGDGVVDEQHQHLAQSAWERLNVERRWGHDLAVHAGRLE